MAKWMLSQKMAAVPLTRTISGFIPYAGTANPYGSSRSMIIGCTAHGYRAGREGWTSFCSTGGSKKETGEPNGKIEKSKRQFLFTTNSWPNIQEVKYEPLG